MATYWERSSSASSRAASSRSRSRASSHRPSDTNAFAEYPTTKSVTSPLLWRAVHANASRAVLGLSTHGHSVTGVDPGSASLTAARAKPGAERVTWIEGTSVALDVNEFDVAVMSSHVAQFFLTDAEWTRTLADVHRALVPGGRLVFDTRDPDAREWERWSTDRRRSVTLSDGRVVEEWTEVTAVEHDTVSFAIHYRFPDHAELVSTATLRFRSTDELRESLHTAGFIVEQIYGGWNREPIGHGDGEFVVIAQADPRRDSLR